MPNTIYDFKVKDKKGTMVDLGQHRGKTVLIVNTASKCGLTPQFKGLETLYETHKDSGLVILGFPCNQFGNQDPGSDQEIQEFCQLNYGVTFPVLGKIDVNGASEEPLFSFLKKKKPGFLSSDIKWNFTKFLIDQNGVPVKRFSPSTLPSKIEKEIVKLIKRNT